MIFSISQHTALKKGIRLCSSRASRGRDANRQRGSAVRFRAPETPVPPDPDVLAAVLEDQRAWAHWLHRAVRDGLLSKAVRQEAPARAPTLLVPRMGEQAWQTAKGGWQKKLDPSVSIGDLLEVEMVVEAVSYTHLTLPTILRV